jgi:SHS2 domain-containing protein
MSYRFLENITLADVAFEADGESLEDLFRDAGRALTNTQVKNIEDVETLESRQIELAAANVEDLLHSFLEELIFYKDTERLLLTEFDITIEKEKSGNSCNLKCTAKGETIDTAKHEMLVDVKAVTWHMFYVKRSGREWKAVVVLDV